MMERQEAQQRAREAKENRQATRVSQTAKQKAHTGQMTRKKVIEEKAGKRAERRLRNNIFKCMLGVVIVLQLICTIELFLVLRRADQIMEGLQNNGFGQESVGQEVSVNGTPINGISENIGQTTGQSGTAEDDVLNNADKIGGKPFGQGSLGTEEVPWNLTLVNKWNKMDEDYIPELATLAEGHQIDARIADDLLDMIQGAKEDGYSIYILSAYREMEKQVSLYDEEVRKWLGKGYSQSAAEQEAGTVVAVPGTSEHQLGLAVDLVSSEHIKLDKDAEKTKGYQWLVKHCHEYGFILRYPNGATDITGIIYEPWHFRYVGTEAATEIMEAGMTLEEYLEAGEKNLWK